MYEPLVWDGRPARATCFCPSTARVIVEAKRCSLHAWLPAFVGSRNPFQRDINESPDSQAATTKIGNPRSNLAPSHGLDARTGGRRCGVYERTRRRRIRCHHPQWSGRRTPACYAWLAARAKRRQGRRHTGCSTVFRTDMLAAVPGDVLLGRCDTADGQLSGDSPRAGESSCNGNMDRLCIPCDAGAGSGRPPSLMASVRRTADLSSARVETTAHRRTPNPEDTCFWLGCSRCRESSQPSRQTYGIFPFGRLSTPASSG